MRIELDADHALRPDDLPHALDDVALDVVVAVRHHGAVQAEQHPVDRHGGLELPENLVAHELVIAPVGRPGGAGGKAAALDEREPVGGRAARDEERRGAHARRVEGMLAGAQEHRFLVGGEAGRQRRESVGLGGKGGGEEAHGRSPWRAIEARYSASPDDRRDIIARRRPVDRRRARRRHGGRAPCGRRRAETASGSRRQCRAFGRPRSRCCRRRPAQAAGGTLAGHGIARDQEAQTPFVTAVGDEGEVVADGGRRGPQRRHRDGADRFCAIRPTEPAERTRAPSSSPSLSNMPMNRTWSAAVDDRPPPPVCTRLFARGCRGCFTSAPSARRRWMATRRASLARHVVERLGHLEGSEDAPMEIIGKQQARDLLDQAA